MEPAPLTPATTDPLDRPLAVVRPLFPDQGSPQPWRPTQSRRKSRIWLTLVGVVLTVGGLLIHTHAATSRVAARLDAGCYDVDDCRTLVAISEATRDSCWLDCQHLASMVAAARSQFRSSLERAAQQEQVRQDRAFESAVAERHAAESARADEAHRRRLDEMERQQRHALQLLEAEAEQLRHQKSELQTQRVAYLKQLTREQRLRRLHACHQQGANCDDLIAALTEAAATESERTTLIELRESFVTGGAVPAARAPEPFNATPSPSRSNSAASEPPLL